VPTAIPTTVVRLSCLPHPSASWRITVLIAGMDRRPGETAPGLTDSLLLLSLDRGAAHRCDAVHPARFVDRDSGAWAGTHQLGLRAGRTERAGRRGFAQATVGSSLGVRVDTSCASSSMRSSRCIDAIGGVTLTCRPNQRPAVSRFSLRICAALYSGGPVHMDGTWALKYMRTRHSSNDLLALHASNKC